jgi:hypothetical protein
MNSESPHHCQDESEDPLNDEDYVEQNYRKPKAFRASSLKISKKKKNPKSRR